MGKGRYCYTMETSNSDSTPDVPRRRQPEQAQMKHIYRQKQVLIVSIEHIKLLVVRPVSKNRRIVFFFIPNMQITKLTQLWQLTLV